MQNDLKAGIDGLEKEGAGIQLERLLMLQSLLPCSDFPTTTCETE